MNSPPSYTPLLLHRESREHIFSAYENANSTTDASTGQEETYFALSGAICRKDFRFPHLKRLVI